MGATCMLAESNDLCRSSPRGCLSTTQSASTATVIQHASPPTVVVQGHIGCLFDLAYVLGVIVPLDECHRCRRRWVTPRSTPAATNRRTREPRCTSRNASSRQALQLGYSDCHPCAHRGVCGEDQTRMASAAPRTRSGRVSLKTGGR